MTHVSLDVHLQGERGGVEDVSPRKPKRVELVGSGGCPLRKSPRYFPVKHDGNRNDLFSGGLSCGRTKEEGLSRETRGQHTLSPCSSHRRRGTRDVRT